VSAATRPRTLISYVGRWRRGRVTKVGVALLVAVVGVALIGPLIDTSSPTAFVGAPLSPPSGHMLLGTDILGRDLLSRVLHGGITLISLAVLASVAGTIVGVSAGVLAGLRPGRTGQLIMRAVDLLLAFPAIVLLLVLATGLGPGPTTVVIAAFIIQLPGAARVYRAATLEVANLPYVESARLRGEYGLAFVVREILPNIARTLAADTGNRFTVSVLLIASANFLGLGLQPPAADWGLMISENRPGLYQQPLGVIVPAVLIAVLAISVNMVADSLARRDESL
jgi:peptide/nickel transport system permease protein